MKFFAIIAALAFTGCAVKRNYVVTTTGTLVGFQIAENPITQIYEVKFGYSRAELALVPTNGVPVLMELRYSGILTRSGGIYQRLAVGAEAVKQPGAAFMFAKDADGRLSTNVIDAITEKIQAIPEAPR